MSKHTPGPWSVGVPGPNGCPTIGTNYGLMTAMIAHSRNEPDQVEECNANANLIAAAPDLLEALERIAELFDPQSMVGGAALEYANSIIAKAKGQSK